VRRSGKTFLLYNTIRQLAEQGRDRDCIVHLNLQDDLLNLTRISIPSCKPWSLVGLRANLGASLIAATVGEFVAADTGLGHLIMEALSSFMTRRVLAVVFVLSLIVIAMDYSLRVLEKRFLKWRPKSSV
jgi:ABC-type nitrate/sulfonate/bicarbonate transport system permease component